MAHQQHVKQSIRWSSAMRVVLVLVMLLVLSACAQLPRKNVVEGPTSAPPQLPTPNPTNGAIFNSASVQPLFEDQRPRYIGDLLTVVIDQEVSATKSSEASIDRSANASLGLMALPEVLGDLLKNQDFDVSGDSAFGGEGGAQASNAFTGTITVMVMNVLPNGNLKVAGEKRIGINKGIEYILFSGVVDPDMISATGTIRSNRVANMRLEYYGDGYISEAQAMGWLQRILLNISPF